MDPVSSTTELVTDIYRDVILTGLLATVVATAWKLSGMHHRAIAAIESVQKAITELKRTNHEDHQDIKERICNHTDRIARLEGRDGPP